MDLRYILSMNKKIRYCGVLLHPTSLPSKHGIGDLGDSALQFVDFLEQAQMGMWQVLPLGPVGFGNSPYASRSAFAGNELLIDLDSLATLGYLDLEELFLLPHFPARTVDFASVEQFKRPLLHKAAINFLRTADQNSRLAYEEFCSKQAFWLDDYALYAALCDYHSDTRWYQLWDKSLAKRTKSALSAWNKKLEKEVSIYKVLQFFFNEQWLRLRRHANAKGISIIGDIPIFVAHDSADAWCNKEYLKMDALGNLSAISGVPPDAYSATGQLWGNPVYDWKAIEKDDFTWWVHRIRRVLEMTDIIRIDHFRGFESYWEVPAGELTAEHGAWVPAPGQKLFEVLRASLGELPIFAEDLGVITEEVEALRDALGLPGMKVAQFAFALGEDGFLDAQNQYLPHNYAYETVAYTGTHDNDTTKGWYRSLDERLRDMVRRYLACSDDQVVWHLMRAVLASGSRHVIIPIQDLLFLDSDARMNLPGTCGSHNWTWRVKQEELTPALADSTAMMIRLFGRTGKGLWLN